ncbi:MAG TPA: Asp23/Gls24 family envelope stress response protein [Lacisediminihabitans sp.]|uniref:Asp23/Gls24 family envelope stress response protein n=1 Tax=Lacisediminihabitans sp. TaxID=2787631 RepID=UPI002ED8DAE2
MSNATPAPSEKTGSGKTNGVAAAQAGTTTILDSVIAKITGIAAQGVPGVHALGGNTARAIGAIRDALNVSDPGQGISVRANETQLAVDLTIVADYPVPLQKVADDVRATVLKALTELVGMEVTEVNIAVNDVHIPADDGRDDKGREAATR